MISLNTAVIFSTISFFLALTPGPDNLYVLMQSTVYGYRTGILITLGLCTGLVIHSMAAALGFASLIQASPLALPILEAAGVSYLVYLAWQAYRTSSADLSRQNIDALSTFQFYRRGIIMNVSNPKIVLFFLAFLPQFTDVSRGDITTQILFLGSLFIAIAFVVMSGIALIAGSLSQWLRQSYRVQRSLHRLTAFILFGLAIHIALTA